jgi:hypothetical protein
MSGMALAWLNRKRGAIVRSVVRQLVEAATAVPYCYVYSIPAGFVPPAGFRPSAYPGLLAWHVVQESAAPRIISYWQDEPLCSAKNPYTANL